MVGNTNVEVLQSKYISMEQDYMSMQQKYSSM